MRRVEVAHAGGAYPVLVGAGALAELGRFIEGPALAVVDAALPELPELELPGLRQLRIEGGEKAKTMAGTLRLLAEFERHRLGRDGTVVAVGGGTIGDLAGFAASIWLRGIALVQVPTTLLAMVDSSIGGKTGVNTEGAKNAVGSFWQPRAVLADTRYLASLPPEQLAGGQAEVVKYAMTLDPGIAGLEDLEAVIERCAAGKARVVAADEREQGLREVLNYGHTVGHAIEAASGYTVQHGRAVAWGMRAAARISARLGLCERSLVETQDELLRRHGLPGERPPVGLAAVLRATASDKKARQGRLRWVLLRGMGRAETGHEVPDAVVEAAVAEILVD